MHFSTAVYVLAPTFALSQATSSGAGPPATAVSAVAADNTEVAFWCFKDWAGSPTPSNVPQGQQLPPSDYTRRLFIEPQLQKVPFSPVIGSEPRVQLPKLWGNGDFRLALLTYATSTPAPRVYSSSKSRWADFHSGLEKLMETCVERGTGGAYLIPPSPGLTQSTMALYAYEVGSKFDFQMNYYMSQPEGIDPSRLSNDLLTSGALGDLNTANFTVPASASVDYTASALISDPPAGYSYVGCYNDTTGERALQSSETQGTGMTAQACASYCRTAQYFGLEFGDQCYCGNVVGSGSVQMNDGCDVACAGDDTQVCGGNEHLTVYQKQTQTA